MPKQPTPLELGLNPRNQFHNLIQTRRDFRAMVSGEVLPVALTHALASLALKHGATPEGLVGARMFINELLYLGEDAPPKTNWPNKALMDERDFVKSKQPTNQGTPNAP